MAIVLLSLLTFLLDFLRRRFGRSSLAFFLDVLIMMASSSSESLM